MQPLGMQIEMEKKSVGELRGGCAMSGLCLRMQSQTQLSPVETQFPIALDILYYHIYTLYTSYHIRIMHIQTVWAEGQNVLLSCREIVNEMLINAHSL